MNSQPTNAGCDIMVGSMTTVDHLECSQTGERYEAGQVHNLSKAGFPLLVRYDLEKARQGWSRDWIANGPTSMWRTVDYVVDGLIAAGVFAHRGEVGTIEVHAAAVGQREALTVELA